MRSVSKYKKSALALLSLFSGIMIPVTASPLLASAATQVPVCTGKACTLFIDKYVNPFIILLSILVGVLAAISIVVAGIQYAASADDPGKVTKAKQRILSTVIGLLAYIFLFAFLNYIVPGGLI